MCNQSVNDFSCNARVPVRATFMKSFEGVRRRSLDMICAVGIVILYFMSTPCILMNVVAWHSVA